MLARLLSAVVLTLALIYGWYWMQIDMLVQSLYALHVFHSELDGPDTAEFVTMLCVCPVLAWLLLSGATRSWRAFRDRVSPGAGPGPRALDVLSQLAVVFILAWPVAWAWVSLGVERRFYEWCSTDGCGSVHGVLISGTCLLLSAMTVWGASRCWRAWLSSRALPRA